MAMPGTLTVDATGSGGRPPHLQFELFKTHHDIQTHAVFTRHGGVSAPPFDSLNVSYSVGDGPEAIAENRARCASMVGLHIKAITTAGLVHGAAVGRLETSTSQTLPDGSRIVDSVDALISSTPGKGLLITAADCLQIMLLDPRTPAVGLAHAGWRGLATGTIGSTIAAMTTAYGTDPQALLAGIGPGLGPCCAEFTDPRRELPPCFAHFIHGRHVDLWGVAIDQLRSAGVPEAGIEQHALCTRCHRDRFFSHRGDRGRSGRFAAIIGLRATHSGTGSGQLKTP
jgi:polyphenol oxidase